MRHKPAGGRSWQWTADSRAERTGGAAVVRSPRRTNRLQYRDSRGAESPTGEIIAMIPRGEKTKSQNPESGWRDFTDPVRDGPRSVAVRASGVHEVSSSAHVCTSSAERLTLSVNACLRPVSHRTCRMRRRTVSGHGFARSEPSCTGSKIRGSGAWVPPIRWSVLGMANFSLPTFCRSLDPRAPPQKKRHGTPNAPTLAPPGPIPKQAAKVRYIDDALAQVVAALKAAGMWENTLFVC